MVPTLVVRTHEKMRWKRETNRISTRPHLSETELGPPIFLGPLGLPEVLLEGLFGWQPSRHRPYTSPTHRPLKEGRKSREVLSGGIFILTTSAVAHGTSVSWRSLRRTPVRIKQLYVYSVLVRATMSNIKHPPNTELIDSLSRRCTRICVISSVSGWPAGPKTLDSVCRGLSTVSFP